MSPPVAVIARSEFDIEQLRADIAEALESRGLDNPEISIKLVETLEHHKESGKIKRFIPLRD